MLCTTIVRLLATRHINGDSDTVKKYRAAYPQPAESDEQLHWLMAAVDIAVQCEVLKESQDTTELLKRLSEVNNLLERKL